MYINTILNEEHQEALHHDRRAVARLTRPQTMLCYIIVVVVVVVVVVVTVVVVVVTVVVVVVVV